MTCTRDCSAEIFVYFVEHILWST